MSELFRLLCEATTSRGRDERVALLLSGGLDSTSVGLALTASGRSVSCYTYELEGYTSEDRPKAEAIAAHYGWPLKVIFVPTDNLPKDFIELATEHRARKKVHFEVTFPLLYIIPTVAEREIWSGWNADNHYGNTRDVILEHAALRREGRSAIERKAHFDEYRRKTFERGAWNADSQETWRFAQRLAAKYDKEILDPYVDRAVFDYFLRYEHDALSSPKKPLVRDALAPMLRELPSTAFAVGVRLQKGGQVHQLFETLLDNPIINRFEPRYTRVSALCHRWAREVAAGLQTTLEGGNGPERAQVGSAAGRSQYRPYTMADVSAASGTREFTVVSTFAGGGGSSIGYRLAGGKVLAANEFVAAAAKTYRSNFPDCFVDSRDIRDIVRDNCGSFLENLNLQVGELDLLDGSPPCSEFSIAGNGIAEEDTLKLYSDVKQRNIAELPFEFVRFATAAKPKVVVMENVPALAHKRSKHVLTAVIEALKFSDGSETARSYYVNWNTLFASDYGVPQRRQRLFIVGVRRDVAEAVGIRDDEDIGAIYPRPLRAPVTIRSALQGLEQTPEEVFPWTRAAMTSSLRGWIERLPKSPNKIIKPQHIDPTEKNYFSLQRCCWDRPAPTLVVFSQQPDGRTGALHPAFDRKFTIAELKRLTALPDDYRLTGTLAQAAERICRMVPPLLTKALAESIYEKIFRPYREAR